MTGRVAGRRGVLRAGVAGMAGLFGNAGLQAGAALGLPGVLGLLAGCATAPPLPDLAPLMADDPFQRLPLPDREALFALSPAMRLFMQNDLRVSVRNHGPQGGLFYALQAGGRTTLDYDASLTRTASEAFEARAGNCLSLVLMTAALAHEMGMSVNYQLVEIPEIWTRSEQFVMLNGHVNLSLGTVPKGTHVRESGRWTIDFQPVEDPLLARVRPLDEGTVVAMFFNNRAVELMEQRQLDEAYAALRAALLADRHHLNTLNTLAVLYRRAGLLAKAEQALHVLLQQEPRNRNAAANLVIVLRAQGRMEEALRVEETLPPSPFADFERGLLLTQTQHWTEALQAFERQLRISPEFHAVHFQLARVHMELGHSKEARQHLEEALDQAPTHSLRQRYQSKLKALKRLAG